MPDLPPNSPQPETRKQASKFITWLIGFFAFLNVYSMQSVLPLVMRDFNASPVQAGFMVGATVLAVAIASPFMGILSDAVGRKKVLCFSLFALTVPTCLIPATSGFAAIIGLRFLQGLAIPGMVVAILAYISEEFERESIARMTTAYVGGTVIGGFCGRFMTGHISEFFGWRPAFIVLAALTLAGALLVLWLLPPSRHFVANRNVRSALHILRSHLRRPRLLAACAVGFCVLFSLVGTFTYINLHLAGAPFNFSASALANVFMVYLVGGVMTPFSGRVILRFGFRNTMIIALAVSALGLFCTLAPQVAVIIAGLTVCASGVFICQSTSLSLIASNVVEGRSLATGLYYMSYYAGGAAGSWIVGIAYESGGWGRSVLSIFLVQMLAATIAWIGYRNPPSASLARP
ncbi:Predicted arabinose efflux permease, MFS family [Formivibrio citricus]|uniref:Predicted arabinose efflux permease, MFS family n=1 Tax=Formivibrio citricus TaxID=83765 RepID=A0A1I5CWS0_9NEIS|nr:MFS transporter [Formivibrio citricus]SFN91378.1 Predicted arabinose efflux permease, MFS family [Formivibrio citricus]